MKDEMKKMDSQAKMDVLKELLQMAMEQMRGKNKSGLEEMQKMKKVSVMAPDKAGLKEGLHKAEDVLSGMPGEEEGAEHEASESPEYEAGEDEEMAEENPENEEDGMSDDEKKMMIKKMMKA